MNTSTQTIEPRSKWQRKDRPKQQVTVSYVGDTVIGFRYDSNGAFNEVSKAYFLHKYELSA